MKKVHKIISCLFAGILFASLFGCADEKAPEPVSLKVTVGHNSRRAEKALCEEFPEIDFEFECYRGTNTTEYLRLQLEHDDTGDIVLGTLKYDDEMCRQHLLDLSGYGFVGNYESSMLNQYDVDGAIYLLPGPIMIRTMAYNKTLFEEKGWKVPTDHGELVALVKQIRAESDLTPIAFGAKGLGYYFTTMTTYAQTACLADARWREWESGYLAGAVSCKEGFQPGIDMLQQLIDADAYDIELDKDHWDGGAMDRLIRREAAMIAIWGGQSAFVDKIADCTDEFALFPFYNENGEPFLGTNVSFHTGLAKRLGEPGNEEKLKHALKVLEWLSTPEGMSCLNVECADILPLTAADNLGTAEIYRDVWETNLSGLKAPMLYTGYEDILIETSEIIRDAMENGKSLDGLTERIDELHKEALNTPKAASLGYISERFSHEETVQLLADVLYASGLADLALVSLGGRINDVVNKTGVSGKLYEGDLYMNNITVYLPGNAVNTPLVIMTLTGGQIRELLETGKVLYGAEKPDTNAQVFAAFDYYFAGMDVEMNEGKVISMKLADGTEVAQERVYTVALAKGDYDDALAKIGSPVLQEVGCRDLFKAYLAENSPISAPELSR